MTQLRESQRILIGARVGALCGAVFGALTALGSVQGDRNIRSGFGPSLVFFLEFLGWFASALVITKLWKYARDERSANRTGMISVMPLVLTSLAVAVPPSEFISISTLFVFAIGDVIGGIIVGETAWKHFGNGSESGDSVSDKRK